MLLTLGDLQTSAKRDPASRFVVETKHDPRIPKLNSRQRKKWMVQGRSIWPRSEYRMYTSPIIAGVPLPLTVGPPTQWIAYLRPETQRPNPAPQDTQIIDEAAKFRWITKRFEVFAEVWWSLFFYYMHCFYSFFKFYNSIIFSPCHSLNHQIFRH